MKLSDVKGERVFDVIAEIIDPICNIAADDKAGELFKRVPLPEGETEKGFLLKRAKKTVPALIKNHKDDLISILASVSGCSPEEYKGVLNLPRLLKDCVDLLTDEALFTLFTSAQTETTFGTAQENITEEA